MQGGESTFLAILSPAPPSELKKVAKNYKEMCNLVHLARKFSPAAQKNPGSLRSPGSFRQESLRKTRDFLKKNRKKSRLAALADPSLDTHGRRLHPLVPTPSVWGHRHRSRFMLVRWRRRVLPFLVPPFGVVPIFYCNIDFFRSVFGGCTAATEHPGGAYTHRSCANYSTTCNLRNKV